MSFDWVKFLDQHNVEYSERGPSTAKGNVYVHCPMCGAADQGRHMGISTQGKGYGCWRESLHRGKAPARLIQALLGCSWQEAHAIAGQKGKSAPADLVGRLKQLFRPEPEAAQAPLELPKEFKLPKQGPSPHMSYLLHTRGFSADEAHLILKHFDVRFSWTGVGAWSWRLVVPVYDRGKLVTWTARAVGESKSRYKTLGFHETDPEFKTKALGPITDYALDDEELERGGEFLVLCEGFFDAARLWLQAHSFDAVTDCLFGKAISPAQLDRLIAVRHLYKEAFILLDPDAGISSLRMAKQLAPLGFRTHLLRGEKDPGDRNTQETYNLLCALEKETA